MRSEKLVHALGEIDDRLILEVIPVPVRRKKRRWQTALLTAAMIALCILGGLELGFFSGVNRERKNGIEEHTVTQAPKKESASSDIAAQTPLPMLTLGTNYVGSGSNIQDSNDIFRLFLYGLQDVETVPETLPVYTNLYPENEGGLYHGWTPDYVQMQQICGEYAQIAGISGEMETNDQFVRISDENGASITVDFRQTVTIRLTQSLPLPENCSTESAVTVEQTGDWLLNTYGGELGMQAPVRVISGGSGMDAIDRQYEIRIHDAGQSVEAYLRNQCFDHVTFRLNQEGIKTIIVQKTMLGERIGDYPIISAYEAETLLLSGCGLTNVWALPEDPSVSLMTLTYLNMAWFDCYMPFYQFLVPVQSDTNGTISYGTFYLPAVDPSYVSDSRYWKTADGVTYNTFREKIYAAPDPDKVGEAAKEAFISYFESDVSLLASYGDYELSFAVRQYQGRDVAILTCKGPLVNGEGDMQTFWYEYAEQVVTYGASGTWSEDGPEYANGIRNVLRSYSAGSADVTYDQVREMFALYFAQNTAELLYLPELSASADVSWEQVSNFAVMCCGLPETFSEKELETALVPYFDSLDYEPGSSSVLLYENGQFKKLAFGVDSNPVFYQLVFFRDLGNGLYEASFDAIEFWVEDEMNADSHSRNWLILQEQYPQTLLTAENYRQYLLDYLCTSDNLPFEVCGNVTVTFRINDTGNPLRYVSCSRYFPG